MEHKNVDEEIKNIAREAGYLLENLSAEKSEQKPIANERPSSSAKRNLVTESQSDATAPPEKSNQLINTDQSDSSIAAGSLISLFLLAALIISLTNKTGTSSSDAPSKPYDDLAGLTKLESESRNAVLICELRPIIEKANSLSLSDHALITRKNKIISDANKSIAFLDASSAKGHKYWEDPSCTWGEQWFDKHGQNSFRAFVALSKKCTNPKLYYEYTRDKEGKNSFKKGSLDLPGRRTGEIAIPFPAEENAYVFIRNVTCS